MCGSTALKNVSNVRFARYTDPTNVSNVSVALRHNNPIPFWMSIHSLMIVIYPTFLRTRRKNRTHILCLNLDHVGINFWTGLRGRIRSNSARNENPQTHILCQDHFFFLHDLDVGIHFWAGVQGRILQEILAASATGCRRVAGCDSVRPCKKSQHTSCLPLLHVHCTASTKLQIISVSKMWNAQTDK